MENNRQIYVVCEYKHGQNVYKDVSLELLGVANALKNQAENEFNLDYKVCAVVLDSGIDADFNVLARHGAQKIIYLKSDKFRDYNSVHYGRALVELINMKNPDIVLFGATNIGREIAPSITSRIKTGLTADCTALSLINHRGEIKLAATRPTFGGVLMATILCRKNPQCATVREGVFKKNDAYEYITDTETINFYDGFFKNDPIKLMQSVIEPDKNNSLSCAKIIFCGGRGLKTKENFEKLQLLAQCAGAAPAASRGAVDMGLAPQDIQVGQTGKTVSPEVYVAFGVSGAIHHISGMSASKTVIAVNTDPNAPIFANCDYKVEADAIQVIEELLKVYA